MKNINWINVGCGIAFACLGVSWVVEAFTSREIERMCASRGGNVVSVSGAKWKVDHVCQLPQVKP